MNKKVLCLVTARASYSRVRTVLINLQNRTGVDLTIVLNASASDPLYGDQKKSLGMMGLQIYIHSKQICRKLRQRHQLK